MLEKITHTNSKNETLNFTSLGIFVNSNDLRDYEWQVSSSNDKITGFKKGVVKKKLPFVFLVDRKKADEIKDQFYEHFDVDVLTQQKGYFTINGYNLYCYATKSVKSDYLVDKKLLKLTLEIQTDEPEWKKEVIKTIDFSKAQASGNSLTYAFSYPYSYISEKTVNVVNPDFVESDAIIRMYGASENPLVKIGTNIYQVNTSLASNEYLEIDTKNKTVLKYDGNGRSTNLFHLRNKEDNIFNKIPNGTVPVSINGEFLVDIVIIETRGEPRWQ